MHYIKWITHEQFCYYLNLFHGADISVNVLTKHSFDMLNVIMD